MGMQRFYEQQGEYISLERLLDHLWTHPLKDGRRMPLLIWGSMGVGKCLEGESLIEVDGRLVRMNDLWERFAGHASPDRDVPEGEWAPPTEPLTVTSLTADGALARGQVVHLYRQRVSEMGRRVTLDDGSSLTMTKMHQLHGLDGWRRDISVGDRVCVPASIPFEGAPIDNDLATLLAWQVSEGYECAKPSYTSITQKASRVDNLLRVRDAATRFGERHGIRMNSMPIHAGNNGSVKRLVITSTEYRAWLEDRGYTWGYTSAAKRLPDFLVAASKPSLATFLREFLAAEATVEKDGGRVTLEMASELLMRQLALMFRRFGIWMRVRAKRRTATHSGLPALHWKGTISGHSLRRLVKEVGIADEDKSLRLGRASERASSSNTEGVPSSDLLRRTRELTKLPYAFIAHPSTVTGVQDTSRSGAETALAAVESLLSGDTEQRYRNSRIQLRQSVCQQFNDFDKDLLRSEVAQPLENRLAREVFYAKVTAVQDVWLDGYVYDVEVEDHHNYVAGGIVSHNTQQIKAYAKERNLLIRSYHPAHETTGADIVGQPIIDEKTGETTYAVPEFLPKPGDPDGILFVDELNRAPELVMAGLMEIFGEGTISQSGWELPDNWLLVAAANPSELGYQVNEMDQAMVDRFLHYAPGWDPPAWAKWAASTGSFKAQVVDFVLANPQLTETGEAQLPLEIENKLKATPRSWDYFDSLYEPELSEGMLRVIAQGILGREVAEEFLRQHLGERPLNFASIARGDYDVSLRRWLDNGDEGLVSASTKHMVAALVGLAVDERLAKRLGRYLALIPGDQREEAWSLLARSAPDWLDPLKLTSARWRQHLAKNNQLFAPAPAR